MALYKYVTPERIDILENSMIRFTPPAELNDPFELKPHINAVWTDTYLDQELYKNIPAIVENVISELSPEIRNAIDKQKLIAMIMNNRNLIKNLAAKESKKYLPVMQRSFSQKLCENIGVLSLTTDPKNLLMWAHYADSHRGFVIQFNECSDFFSQRRSNNDELWYLRKVDYKKDRPSITLSEVEDFSAFLTKGVEWQYEKEWRMMAPLSSASITVGERSQYHLFQLPSSAIKAIIFGSLMSTEDTNKILFIIKEKIEYCHIKIIQASIDDINYKINTNQTIY